MDKLATPINIRIETLGTRLIRATWLKVPYVYLIRFAPHDKFNIAATCFLTKERYYSIRSTPLIINTAKWYSRVYRRGLAIIDDVFVLDVLSSDEHGHIVQAVQVVMENEVIVSTIASKARVTIATGETGPAKLSWLTDEQ